MAADRLHMYSWYHGAQGRTQAETILLNQRAGLFLVRDSQSLQGGYVLSVSENRKVSHYIITQRNGQYQIGDQTFSDLPEIVDYYRRHFLDTTTLVEAAPRQTPVEADSAVGGPGAAAPPVPSPEVRVRAKYNFPGKDPDDLPFKKNDILTIIKKEEEQWWMARDCTGKEGVIPVNYIEVIQNSRSSVGAHNSPWGSSRSLPGANVADPPAGVNSPQKYMSPAAEVNVPAVAEAIQDRHPTVYDPSELKFEKGDQILVLKMLDSGSWDGQLKDGRTGTFPFRYVKVVTSDPEQIALFRSNIGPS